MTFFIPLYNFVPPLESLFAPSRINAVEKQVWKLKLERHPRYKKTAKAIYYMVILQPVIQKRFHKVNIGGCCTLAAEVQSAFDERNFCFYYIRSRVFLLLSNVNIQTKSHFAIFRVLVFLRNMFPVSLL